MAKKIIISGGGTGGHIFPAIAIAQAIHTLQPDTDILFVGAKGKMEMEKVPNAGYKIIGLDIVGFQRSLSWQNLLFPIKIGISFFQAIRILIQFKPSAIVGFGGFASGPILFCGNLFGIKTYIQEQNSHAGITNRILGKFAKKICVAYENMELFFPKHKIELTGNPVRKDIQNIAEKKDLALSHFKLDASKKTILIVGGSLGARSINNTIKSGVDELLKQNAQVIWQTGSSLSEEDFARFQNANHIHIARFIQPMDLAYSAADIVVSRSGALSVSEICVAGKPAIFIPFPFAADNHQYTNAQALVKQSAAICIEDKNISSELIPAIVDLLRNEAMQKKMETEVKKMAKPYAASTIANIILSDLT